MLDINFIRENPNQVKQACQEKKVEIDLDQLLRLDQQRRDLLQKIQTLRQQRNQLTRNQAEKGKKIKQELKDLEPKLKETEKEFSDLMLKVPNVPAVDAPRGNKPQVIRTWGKIPEFDFPAKDHIVLGENLDLIDFKAGSSVSGFRGYFLKNEAVLMHLGLMQWALQKLIKKGFTPLSAPAIAKQRCFLFTGHFPWGEKEAYQLEQDQYLAGTAEVPLVAYFSGKIFNEKDLPIAVCGFSPCFRKEAGSYGRDTRGIYRLHEFLKIEQVVICRHDMAESEEWLEKLAQNSEELLQELELPYRVCLMPTEDMGEPQVKKYDIEAWMPGRKAYGEVMSDSIMGDFQARRAGIKYRTKKGETLFVHTLNNTAIASPRILIAILENCQQKDGSVKVPLALQPYVGREIIKR